ncbi:hypothetical protein IKE86_02355 [Candidatus Saccharibacteria bacterium]|nr:hypothetical protein [Candidatus Saccharibacteria bacterium]
MQNNSPSNTPPEKPAGDGQGTPGGQPSGADVVHAGATVINESTTATGESYSSTTGGENAILVVSGESTLTTPTVTKSGDESSENSDFYGTNAAVLATDGVLNIDGGTVTTSGAHANGIFATDLGKIVVKNTAIKTTGNNSGGIMVTGGATLTAESLTVETSGNSSAPIRSDRGGGTMTITGGSYTSNGVGSPAIYSTADITASGATLASNASEGIVIEGSNSVRLENVTLTDTNNTLNGNSETYKNIFIYQSMSGDASEGTGTFSANNSTITTNQGDTFFVTNTTANISLENNRIVNNDASSAFLRAQSGKWGTAGANGGIVKLSLTKQVAEGDIVLDSVSSLSLVLSDQSFYMGIINGANTAQSIDVTLDATSQLILAGDSYINTLTNADSTNMNIYSNGYKLYVAGTEVDINGSAVPEAPEVIIEEATEKETAETVEPVSTPKQETNYTPYIVGGIALLVIIGAIIAFVLHNKKKKGGPTQGDSVISPDGSMTTPGAPADGRPDFSQFDDGPVQQPAQPQQPPRQQPPLVGQV